MSDIDFSKRVELADNLIDAAKSVARTISGSPTEESEVILAKQMVHLRNTLVEARDETEFAPGPAVRLKKMFVSDSYLHFNDGLRAIATAYMAIQEKRCLDIDWTEAAKEIPSLRAGVEQMLDFLTVAHAVENGIPHHQAKHQLQLARDRRRTNSPAGDDSRPLLPENGRAVSANDRMTAKMQSDPETIEWSANQWGQYLGVTDGAVKQTKSWDTLMKVRRMNAAEQTSRSPNSR